MFLLNFQPLEQFEIYVINGLSLVFGTNLAFFVSNLVMSFFFVFLFFSLVFLFPIKDLTLIPNFWQILLEDIYKFIVDIVFQQVGNLGQKFFPLIFSIFFFILFSNLLGMIPYSFTLTSHIMMTFTLSLSVFLFLTILGFLLHKFNFLKLFVPSGIPTFLIPFLVIIELISYVSRAFSLGIRLFANMMSGHALLNILSGFVIVLYKSSNIYLKLLFLIPFIIVFLITFLELGIAFLQAYVFVILICIYLNDSFHPAH